MFEELEALISAVWALIWSLIPLTLALTVAVVALGGGSLALAAWSMPASARDEWSGARSDTVEYWRCVMFFLRGGDYTACPQFAHASNGRETRARIFSMCLALRLWSEPHYRNGTFQDDMRKNLRNVAIPGTGLPLSLFAAHRALAWLFILAIYPCVSLAAALIVAHLEPEPWVAVAAAYRAQLLNPEDWFGFWRMNCALASYHALVTQEPEYRQEDKLVFLEVAKTKNIAVTEWITEYPAIICKHRNEEGGLGIQVFRNAAAGGDWIIQELLSNDASLTRFLPDKAPLSTFRVITASTYGANEISALSCVWRAGLQGASTDHTSVLFDVDQHQGEFRQALTTTHWYKLWGKAFRAPWRVEHDIQVHPDSGQRVTGEKLDAASIVNFAVKAHKEMLPRVPIIGWDVALTNKGMMMLECNLSCNFFYGTFDKTAYFAFYHNYLVGLERLEKERKAAGADVKAE